MAQRRKKERKAATHSMGITACDYVGTESTNNYYKVIIMVTQN
jgi:hypothetical protein